jgi:tetratricopeptide (TPR) repeat protein
MHISLKKHNVYGIVPAIAGWNAVHMRLLFLTGNRKTLHTLLLFLVIVSIIQPVAAETADYWISTSYSLSNAGRYQEALEACDKAIVINPTSATAWSNKATILFSLQRYQEAVNAADKAMSYKENYFTPLLTKGAALNRLGKHAEALAAAETVISWDPANYKAWNNKAAALDDLKRYTEAIEAADTAIALKSDYAKPWLTKGDSLRDLGRNTEAIAAYDRAIALDPTYVTPKEHKQVILDYLLSNNTNISPSSSGSLPLSLTQNTTADLPAQMDTPSSFLPLAGGIILLVAIVGIVSYIMLKSRQKGLPGPGSVLSAPPETRVVGHEVFISYSHQDKPTADAICNALESKNVKCWIAPRDILPGVNYQESIVDAIDASLIMILVFSSFSNESPHVIRELTRAVGKRVIIIPFKIEEISPSKSIEYLISVPHWLDAMTPPLERHIEELGNTVRILLDNDKKKKKESA